MAICQKYYTKGLTVSFTASIPIPIGYTLDGIQNYALTLSLDKSNVGFSVEEQLRPSLIIIEEEEIELCCKSKLLLHHLRGTLGYNIIASKYKAIENFYVDTRTTYFSAHDDLFIDGILAYTCPECETVPIILNDFDINIMQDEEHIVDEHGNIFPKGNLVDTTNPFVKTLLNYSITRTLYIPFILTFKSLTH